MDIVTDEFRYDSAKFKELLLLVAAKSAGDPNFGKTKLNKLLYYIDFVHYGKYGKPVTGAEYQRRSYGPVPKQVRKAEAELVTTGAATVAHVDRFGRDQQRLIANRSADLSIFSTTEIELVGEVVENFWEKSGVEISEYSHQEPGWRISKDGETIPYCTAFLSSRAPTADDIKRGQEIWQEIQDESTETRDAG